MYSILSFKNSSYHDDHRKVTIAGENFQVLMDLCFANADTFSLRRCGWPGAHDGALEQALRPYLLGEYRSYSKLIWFDKECWEKCYLYQATEETKKILLECIRHLFDREPSPAPAGHEEYLHQKYAAFYPVEEEANNRWLDYICNEGDDQSEEQQNVFEEEVYREARKMWLNLFSEDDYYSTMEDPCFFQGTEMFFQTITHEQDCIVRALSPKFEARLYQLGEWVCWSDRSCLPLLSLDMADDWKPYQKFEITHRQSS